MSLDGVVIVNKPKGLTSAKVVDKVKRKLKTKVGHTGTLDPMATGVLVLLVGRATRFSWLFLEMDKEYEAVGTLGITTDTYDLQGEVIKRSEVKVSCRELRNILLRFTGKITQTPPPYSAKKIKGKRAYKLARKGEQVELKPVEVEVYEAKLLECSIPDFKLLMKSSSGTYIRTLIHDMGEALSCGAAVKELKRLSVGVFTLSQAVELSQLLSSEYPQKYVIPMEQALSFLPRVELNVFYGQKILNGNPVMVKCCSKEGYVTIFIDNIFVGVGRLKDRILKPERLLIPDTLKT